MTGFSWEEISGNWGFCAIVSRPEATSRMIMAVWMDFIVDWFRDLPFIKIRVIIRPISD
jgi:hypothetical protein